MTKQENQKKEQAELDDLKELARRAGRHIEDARGCLSDVIEHDAFSSASSEFANTVLQVLDELLALWMVDDPSVLFEDY